MTPQKQIIEIGRMASVAGLQIGKMSDPKKNAALARELGMMAQWSLEEKKKLADEGNGKDNGKSTDQD